MKDSILILHGSVFRAEKCCKPNTVMPLIKGHYQCDICSNIYKVENECMIENMEGNPHE